MKFHPILFSTPLVQAILDGNKTMTRRIINNTEDHYYQSLVHHATGKHTFVLNDNYNPTDKDVKEVKCPYGEVGDVLWVREEHYAYGIWVKNGTTKTGKQKYKFKRTGRVYYNDTYPEGFKFYKSLASHTKAGKLPDSPSFYKRLSRFMPKKFCRIFLQIKSIKVERLQDISEADAIAEGVLEYDDGTYKNYSTKKGLREQDGVECLLAKGSFQTLWMEINGIENWKENPWLWVIEFQRIEKPSTF